MESLSSLSLSLSFSSPFITIQGEEVGWRGEGAMKVRGIGRGEGLRERGSGGRKRDASWGDKGWDR